MHKPKKAPLIMSIALASALASGVITAGENEFKRMHPSQSKNMVEIAQTKTTAAIADNAEKYLGIPYYFGGRDSKQNPGLDCLGLVFKSIQDTYGKDWSQWSVMPSKLIRQLGRGSDRTLLEDEVTRESISLNFKRGDILFFLSPYENRDEPVRKLEYKDERGQKKKLDLWVWHVAIYAGEGKIIHASSYDENYTVLKEDLYEFYKRNNISGIIAVTYGGE
ncbi:MAG: hypothetical protein QXU54_03460 [Candidatus Micrarchaeia archaeon]